MFYCHYNMPWILTWVVWLVIIYIAGKILKLNEDIAFIIEELGIWLSLNYSIIWMSAIFFLGFSALLQSFDLWGTFSKLLYFALVIFLQTFSQQINKLSLLWNKINVKWILCDSESCWVINLWIRYCCYIWSGATAISW